MTQITYNCVIKLTRQKMKIRMKTGWYLSGVLFAVALIGCAGDSATPLSEQEVREFAVNHIESQVGFDEAVEPYKSGLSSETKYFTTNQDEPKNANLENVDGAWFFEDSVKADVMDVQLYGSAASVMGVMYFHTLGAVGQRSFHGTVVRDGDRLRWDRWFHQDHGQLAKNYIPNNSDVEGAVALCNSMAWMALQGDGSAAGALSDSLIALDPSMALAHVGSLWRAWFAGDGEAWEANVAEAVEKSQDSATKYYFMSHSDVFGDQLENAQKAYALASDSPLTQIQYAWHLMAVDAAAARLILEQTAKRWGALGAPNNLLGYLNMREGDMESAEICFKRYVRLAPDVANAHDSMGDFYAKKGDNESARACYAKAIELDDSFESSKKKMAELDS